MNKKFIFLTSLVLFAGCSATENLEEVPEITGDILKVESTQEIENVEPVESVAEPVVVEEMPAVVPVSAPVEEVVEEFVPEVEVEEKNQNKPVEEIVKDNLKTSLYKYPFEVKGKTVNIELYNTLEELEKNDFNIGITQEQFFDTETYFFVFNSKPSSNGAVVKVSGRLYPILSIVLNYPMKTTENLVQSDVLTCKDSTLAEKILVFDSSASTNEVVYDSVTGCIEFKTTSQDLMGTLGDKFFYEVFE